MSAEPLSPPTVEKRAVARALLPTLPRNSEHVKSEMSSVTSKTPWAPPPLAWTTRSLTNKKGQIPLSPVSLARRGSRDTFPVEVSELIDVEEVLQEKRAVLSRPLSGVGLLDRVALRIREDGSVALCSHRISHQQQRKLTKGDVRS